MLGRFFKLPKTKQFYYQPRYYDERKEALDKRVAQIKAEMGITGEKPGENNYFRGSYQTHIKGQMKSQLKSYFKQTRKQRQRSNIRLLVILLILLALTWYIIFY